MGYEAGMLEIVKPYLTNVSSSNMVSEKYGKLSDFRSPSCTPIRYKRTPIKEWRGARVF